LLQPFHVTVMLALVTVCPSVCEVKLPDGICAARRPESKKRNAQNKNLVIVVVPVGVCVRI
jgi:hypothetical protein